MLTTISNIQSCNVFLRNIFIKITQADYMLAQRRAARMEEIAEHGKPVSLRSAVHRSKKVYDRKRLKKIDFD